MNLIVLKDGCVRCVYGEAIELASLGTRCIRRASFVEPDKQGRWWVDLKPLGGPVLGPFGKRSEALGAESRWLEAHWLGRPPAENQSHRKESDARGCRVVDRDRGGVGLRRLPGPRLCGSAGRPGQGGQT